MSKRFPLAAILLLLALPACGGGGESGSTGAEPKEEEPLELTLEEELEAELDIPDEPDWMTSGYGSVWVARGEAGVVDRIDPDTNEVVASVKVGGHPGNGLVAEFGSVWVPSYDDQAVYRIDPERRRYRR